MQCSRAIESKGWRAAIEIMEESGEAGRPAVHLVLIGDGPIAAALKTNIRAFAARRSSSDRSTGRSAISSASTWACFPSTFEGETFPLFLLECFQMGLPAATTDIGEIPRIMKGANQRAPGITIDHTLAPAQLADAFICALGEMFSLEGAYEGFRSEALATSERFGIAALADLYADLLADLAHETRRAATDAVAAA